MIQDYKGEMPNNVTTPGKAKAQKPFYKNWKFWLLTGLMTLFGACSIYGLVLGSQYVKAIERASHIIADAQSSDNASFASKKGMLFASTNDYKMCRVDLGSLNYGYSTASGHERFFTTGLSSYIVRPTANSVVGKLVCEIYETDSSNNVYNHRADKTIGVATGGDVNIYDSSAGSDPLVFKNSLAGVYLYFLAYSDASVPSVYDEGYSEGYAEGSSDGYETGYQEGYSDGSDAINVNQSVKVLLPAGSENSCSFVTYLDGVADQQGILSSSTSFGAYGEFERNRNQKLRIDLTLPSGSRAFFLYVPHWTSAFPSQENYSLRQSWAVSGVTYLPTWVAQPEIYVDITSASVEDLTYQTISVAFDVDHWGDIKVGAYQQGYQQGYVDGQENPTAYQSGYDAGYSDGERQGQTDGFNRGVAVGSSGSQSLAMMFKTAFQLPFDQLYRFLNFNLLGINFLSLFTALISVSIGIMVIKKVL